MMKKIISVVEPLCVVAIFLTILTKNPMALRVGMAASVILFILTTVKLVRRIQQKQMDRNAVYSGLVNYYLVIYPWVFSLDSKLLSGVGLVLVVILLILSFQKLRTARCSEA